MMVIFRAQRRELVILWVYIVSVITVNMFKHLVVSFNIKELNALQGRKITAACYQWTMETTACKRYPATYSHW